MQCDDSRPRFAAPLGSRFSGYTSTKAGANWMSYAAPDDKRLPSVFGYEWNGLPNTYRFLRALAALKHTTMMHRPAEDYWDDAPGGQWFSQLTPNSLFSIQFAEVPKSALPKGAKFGISFETTTLNPRCTGGVSQFAGVTQLSGRLLTKFEAHNYGHGGYGLQSSWGCAESVLNIVRKELGETKAAVPKKVLLESGGVPKMDESGIITEVPLYPNAWRVNAGPSARSNPTPLPTSYFEDQLHDPPSLPARLPRQPCYPDDLLLYICNEDDFLLC
ncbi:hypothetical protein BDK51DRAFT_36637 [Blyttiomyces helicus]|uniref:FAD dependent oxidoreductase domain-containing protein n=1 Tax=Blyttiomyces helicus TaxID=388810 RepID=A0A4V1IPS5_9FUNG|nr:hypothetical protein BDK51DRAFT_36637 [Blyttiomyces helicus]|eukprot:RKO84077.1 hypothetical protein BDK51DRAFT_36637 [Blyttiomyces helicus]